MDDDSYFDFGRSAYENVRERRRKVGGFEWKVHLEHADTGLETLSKGVSAALGPERSMFKNCSR